MAAPAPAPAPARSASPLLRPLVVLALPGMYLLYKYNQFRQQQTESARRRVTERELLHLNTKIDKLLNKLDENEPEVATSQEDECVICVNAKATMQTSPCGHRVVCRRCFVKTIQMAVSQRLLPLRCVICRAKILRLRHSAHPARTAPRLTASKSWQATSSSAPRVPGSVSCYSVGARSVPASASLYSVTSGESSLSGVSSVSSGSGLSRASAACAGKLCAGARCGGACLGAVPRAPPAAPLRQPCSGALRRSQQHSMKVRLQEYATHGGGGGGCGEGGTRLPPIREFQREFREGRRGACTGAGGGDLSDLPPASPAAHPAHPAPPVSVSTRIRCAQKIVTQLECSPQKKTHNFFRTPLRALSARRGSPAPAPPAGAAAAAATRASRDPAAVAPHEEPSTPKPRTEEKKKKEEDRKKEESVDNNKNEAAERKREEKARLKAEKEAKSRAKREAKAEERRARQLAREQERQAKLLARQLERQARLDARDEKKRAKRDAKLAAQAERDRTHS